MLPFNCLIVNINNQAVVGWKKTGKPLEHITRAKQN